MSRTNKDLKSHKTGIGRYGRKPQRKLTPFIHDANKIVGKNEVLSCLPDNDIKQDDFEKGYHWHNAKAVRAIRKKIRAERGYEKSKARGRIKQFDKKICETQKFD
ncbi:MAG: hypothetical protein WC333_01825 [Dehalococcoidia bacterium]|jgi:hypothetical protein